MFVDVKQSEFAFLCPWSPLHFFCELLTKKAYVIIVARYRLFALCAQVFAYALLEHYYVFFASPPVKYRRRWFFERVAV